MQEQQEDNNQTDIEKYATDQIIKIQDDFSMKMNYLEFHDYRFQCVPFINASKEVKNKYQITKQLKKYFGIRYFLFSMFDQGIQIDRESWYSVVAEPIALHLRERLKYYGVKRVFQPFCGVGGLAIQFADHFTQLVVNDIDPTKIKMLKNNLSVYAKGLNMLKIQNKDVFNIQPFETDCVVICPPWGGIDIQQYSHRDLDDIMFPKLTDILNHCRKFSENMVLQMPKNTNLKNFIKIINMANLCPLIKIQKIIVNQKISQLFIYIGNKSFTGLLPSVYNIILNDLAPKTNENNHKNLKKQIKKKMQEKDYKIFQDIYHRLKPNKHIFFE